MNTLDKLAASMTERPWVTMASGWAGLPAMARISYMHWGAHGLELSLVQGATMAFLVLVVLSLPVDLYLQHKHNTDRVRIVAWTAWLFMMLPLAIVLALGVFGMMPGEGTA